MTWKIKASFVIVNDVNQGSQVLTRLRQVLVSTTRGGYLPLQYLRGRDSQL